ncbi:MAG: large conductance mechanosensitive channel protein MscL [Acidobacteriaceae bacterium]|nr:large conductance mechanosensitive channel protein MscL [Acidobacteriaceae bacterium]
MLRGFRDFILRGNVVDLAVAVIIGAAFGKIITAFTTNIISPLIGAIVGKPDFSYLFFTLNGGKIGYGSFLTAVIDFLIQAAVVYFLLVVPINYLMAKVNKPAETTTKTCDECLSEIPLTAKRCKFCAQPVA